MTEALVADLKWDVDKAAFERQLRGFIKAARDNNKVIPLPVSMSLETLVMLLAQVNCAGCDAKCCREGTPGGAIELAPGEYKIMIQKYGEQGFTTAPPNGGIIQPCRFLQRNQCTIYSERPMACMLFPMQLHGGLATSRGAPMVEALSVASSCPEGRRIAKAVYKATYMLKQKYWSIPSEELKKMLEGGSQ
jgi:Fe-S-cluster containining protein